MRAVDLIEMGITQNLFDLDVRTAVENVYELWREFEPNVIERYWRKTGIIPNSDSIELKQ